MGDIGKGLDLVFYAFVWTALTLVATLFILGMSFTSLWTPWFFLTYVVTTALFVVLRLTVLSLD